MKEKRSPTLRRVMRLDNIPLDKAQFTEEGYLMDRPVVTTTGIFEYKMEDGSVRRDLRLPEEVFDPESLASYKGKPIILTHAGGRISKENVQGEHIGTILSDGYQDGEDVRAEIVIHNPDVVDRSGLKELSLGYDCDLEETPGEWNGQPYDAIQRNIRINHLAVVHMARAGKKARLNIDSAEEILKGGREKVKKVRRKDSVTPEQAESMFKQFLAWLEAGGSSGATAAPADEGEAAAEERTDEEIIEQVRSHQDEGEPEDPVSALARAKEDVNDLLGVIDKMKAEQDMSVSADEGEAGDESKAVDEGEPEKTDEECPEKTDEGEADPEKTNEDEPDKVMNADSIDALVRTRVEIGRLGDMLNLDGLDTLSTKDAKKQIILAVRPGMLLDGKSDAYINAAYDMARSSIMQRKDVAYQRDQIAGREPSGVTRQDSQSMGESAAEKRQRMINRRSSRKEK